MKTKNDNYIWVNEGKQYHLQKYIEGETFELNTAPDWFMRNSAQTLGKIHKELNLLKNFPTGMGADFFKYSSPENTRLSYIKTLEHAKKINYDEIVIAL